ncbi:hypothetical protein HPP92_020949 [Vanilla planifolia]|uniref:Uncharacterized protein n=1 Tax=Vanilla planifolia TaxID=51239 RepID=A0A835UIB6_VANPL|nr:hypothetical protein HPP92_021269 [Vanilla planifolia]KAG0462473.1 hypothetical protein HPP92_020949 [Vanilla planifolia]
MEGSLDFEPPRSICSHCHGNSPSKELSALVLCLCVCVRHFRPFSLAIGIIIDATTEGHVVDWDYAFSMSWACEIFIFVSKGYVAQESIVVPKSSFIRCFAMMLGIG